MRLTNLHWKLEPLERDEEYQMSKSQERSVSTCKRTTRQKIIAKKEQKEREDKPVYMKLTKSEQNESSKKSIPIGPIPQPLKKNTRKRSRIEIKD